MIGHASFEDTRVLGGSGGGASPENFSNSRFSNCWKYACIETVNPIIYHHHVSLFHFKSFMILLGGTLWLLGGCVRTPCQVVFILLPGNLTVFEKNRFHDAKVIPESEFKVHVHACT